MIRLRLLFKWVIMLLFILLGIYVVIYGLFRGSFLATGRYYSLIMFCCGGAVIVIAAVLLRKHKIEVPKINSKATFFALLAICVVLKLAWVLTVRIDPEGDYLIYYQSAEGLSHGLKFTGVPSYLALFPHIFGYSSFLSVFFAIFGTSPMVALVLNVVLTAVSMSCIYYLSEKFISHSAAIIASLIWIIFPSQTIYNMFVLSEPFYTTFLLLSFCVMANANESLDKRSLPRNILIILLLALLLAILNSARPIAPIVLISILIIGFILMPVKCGKRLLMRRILLFVILCVSYLGLTSLNSALFKLRTDTEPSTTPGYSICVGFNMESRGQWNEEDSALLYNYLYASPTFSAEEAQNNMLREAVERIKSGEINYPRLIVSKIGTLWGTDSSCVFYANGSLTRPGAAIDICNAFYYVVWALAVFGAASLLKRKKQSPIIILPLFVVGLTMAQMLVEVAGRYHYSGIPSIVILSALGLSEILGMNKKTNPTG